MSNDKHNEQPEAIELDVTASIEAAQESARRTFIEQGGFTLICGQLEPTPTIKLYPKLEAVEGVEPTQLTLLCFTPSPHGGYTLAKFNDDHTEQYFNADTDMVLMRVSAGRVFVYVDYNVVPLGEEHYDDNTLITNITIQAMAAGLLDVSSKEHYDIIDRGYNLVKDRLLTDQTVLGYNTTIATNVVNAMLAGHEVVVPTWDDAELLDDNEPTQITWGIDRYEDKDTGEMRAVNKICLAMHPYAVVDETGEPVDGFVEYAAMLVYRMLETTIDLPKTYPGATVNFNVTEQLPEGTLGALVIEVSNDYNFNLKLYKSQGFDLNQYHFPM